jgi:hypothetical protein
MKAELFDKHIEINYGKGKISLVPAMNPLLISALGGCEWSAWHPGWFIYP